MITEFGVGNFQAFGELQRVPLKPITLIFGPNSAGKSALIRSLLVAQHAILNGKLSKSEGANDRHPGAYSDMARNGSAKPISFGFTVQESNVRDKVQRLEVSWKESSTSDIEVVSASLMCNNSEVVSYASHYHSKNLHIASIGSELKHIMSNARWNNDHGDILDHQTHTSIKRRLALTRNSALPGTDVDQFRIEKLSAHEQDFLDSLKQALADGKTSDLVLSWMQRIENCVASLQSEISKQFDSINILLRTELATLIYHGPIRPICDEISKAKKLEPGMDGWWNLAADPKLLSKVNDWLTSDKFKTKYRLEFDRLFPDSSLQELLKALSYKIGIEYLVEVAFEAKLNNDEAFFESLIDEMAPDLEQYQDDEEEEERVAAARQQARDSILNGAWDLATRHYDALLDESDLDEIQSFLLLGVNQIQTSLRGKLESVRQGKTTTTPGGFDSAKVRFCDLGSSKAIAPSNMGIGFSQMMPLVASAFGSENRLIAIEQPELHVHPGLQTELADLFIQSAMERKNRFLIETHSEHLILRIMRRMRETFEGNLPDGMRPITPNDVCILYVEPGENGSIVREMPLNERGELIKGWPGGFFEEALNEML